MSVAPSDAELLAAHRAGDPAAFAALVARHQRALWALARRTLAHPDDAADAVQEALVAADRRAETFRGDASVRTWLHRIVVNSCIDRIRRERVRPTVPLSERHEQRPPGAAGRDVATEVVNRLAITDALAELPAAQRLAVVLVDVQGWSVTDAADVLEVPVGTVKSRCARARTKLAMLLGHLQEVP